jgi:hypothetical protein
LGGDTEASLSSLPNNVRRATILTSTHLTSTERSGLHQAGTIDHFLWRCRRRATTLEGTKELLIVERPLTVHIRTDLHLRMACLRLGSLLQSRRKSTAGVHIKQDTAADVHEHSGLVGGDAPTSASVGDAELEKVWQADESGRHQHSSGHSCVERRTSPACTSACYFLRSTTTFPTQEDTMSILLPISITPRSQWRCMTLLHAHSWNKPRDEEYEHLRLTCLSAYNPLHIAFSHIYSASSERIARAECCLLGSS